ncbi:MAG: tRNA lysidine(34) synthetase TilS [Proteobacteria bacterium]|nr:tRNA lysidine(34) synthetase TilS [Pseudomonadota bacterium]
MAIVNSVITQHAFAAAMQELSAFPSNGSRIEEIALAVSGGVDSMCMAYLMHSWAQQNSAKIVVLIVDHRLRTESTAEAITVRNWLEANGIEAHILPWISGRPKSNIHQLARTERYRLLTNYCKANNISRIVTAHNADDQAETIMMRIARGTGLTGLTGIKASGMHNGISVLRPLLQFSRQQIRVTMEMAGWQWIEDPSNNDPKYTRTKIRRALQHFPHKELLNQRCNLLAHNLSRTETYLVQQTENFIKTYVGTSKSNNGKASITINHQALCDEHEEIALRALRAIFQHYVTGLSMDTDGGDMEAESHPPRLASLERLYQHLIKGGIANKKAHTMRHCKIWAKGGIISIVAE